MVSNKKSIEGIKVRKKKAISDFSQKELSKKKKDKKIIIEKECEENLDKSLYVEEINKTAIEENFYIKKPIKEEKTYTSIFSKKLKNKNKKIRKKIFKILILLISAFLVVFFFMNYFDRSTVSIEEKIEIVKLDTQILAQKNPLKDQLGFDIIAVTESYSRTIEATTSQKVEEKASGKIIVYNKYSSASQRLLPETRFETPDGLIFKLGKDGEVIPGRIDEEPGSVEVIIYAEKAGDEYNVDLTDFVIPGYDEAGLTDKFNKIYGLSKTKMEGGFIGEKRVVSEEDKELARNELKIKIKEKLSKSVKEQKTNDFILADNSYKFIFGEITEEEIEGKEEVILNQKGVLYAVLINKDSLNKYLASKLFPEDREENILINNIDEIKIDLITEINDIYNAKSISLKITGDSIFNWKVNEKNIIDSLSGKDKNIFESMMREYKSIEKARLNISPIWKKTISENNNIRVKLISLKVKNLN